jgi:hypothetical protein
MQSFLRGLPARLFPRTRRERQNRRTRSLVFEQLGARQLLAGDQPTSLLHEEELVAPVGVEVAAVQGVTAESPLWGDPSDSESLVLQENGYGYGNISPEILNFSGTNGGAGWWTFSGQVIDDSSVDGLTVTFGGLLEGHTTTVGTDGTFEHVANLPSGTSGVVTATVTDRDGLTSETVYWYVG